MHTINHSLERAILDADGRYLDTQELHLIDQYVQSYEVRLQTYQQLRDNSEKLVMHALRRMSQAYPDLIQKYGQRCKYDMSEVLRYVALSILRDDEVFFKEQMISWLDTILVAHKRTAQCVNAYRYLQEAIAATFPAPSLNLIRPYLDITINALQSHA